MFSLTFKIYEGQKITPWKILDEDRYGYDLDIKLFKTEINMDNRDWYSENFYFQHIFLNLVNNKFVIKNNTADSADDIL